MNTLQILYRELHYRRLKNNPRIAGDPEKLKKQLRTSGDIKRGIGLQTALFLFFGAMMAATVAGAGDERRAVVMFATYSILPFVMSLYTTSVNASYATSMGIFEPLKALPIETGSKYLSMLLMIDNIPAATTLLPSVGVLMWRYPVQGVLGLLWVLTGVFLGHVLGLVLFSLVGTSGTGGRFSRVRAVGRVLGVLMFISMFYAINFIQSYVSEHYNQVAPLFTRYSVAYPFSVASISRPAASLALLSAYLAVLMPLYLAVLKRLWREMEGGTTTRKVETVRFRARTCHPIIALAKKDLHIVVRKSSLLVGILMPLFIVLPTAINMASSQRIDEASVISVMLMIAWMGSVTIDTVLKIDGREFELLRGLPITLKQFIGSKMVVMNLVPVLSSLGIVALTSYSEPSYLKLIPMAVALPLVTSSMALWFVYHGERELSIPETDFGHVMVIMLVNGVSLGVIAGLWYVVGYPAALAVAVTEAAVLLWSLMR